MSDTNIPPRPEEEIAEATHAPSASSLPGATDPAPTAHDDPTGASPTGGSGAPDPGLANFDPPAPETASDGIGDPADIDAPSSSGTPSDTTDAAGTAQEKLANLQDRADSILHSARETADTASERIRAEYEKSPGKVIAIVIGAVALLVAILGSTRRR